MKWIFHIDMNSFFASVEEVNNPKLKNQPIAVAGKTKRSVVSSANYLARSFGVQSAMPIFNAKILCPKLIVVDHHFYLYEKYSRLFINLICEKITNKVEIASIDECFVDVTHLVKNETEACQLAKKIQQLIFDTLKLGTSIGVASNKFLAKMASDYKKPMGITKIVSPLEIKECLWSQPIENMYFIGASSAKILRENGILTIGDIANQNNKKIIEKLLDRNWETHYLNANGVGNDELDYSQNIPKSVSVSETFLNDTNNYDEIVEKIKVFTNEIVYRLGEYNQSGRTLSVTIKLKNFVVKTKSYSLKNFINKYEEMLPLFIKLYRENFYGEEIRLVGVGISNLTIFDGEEEDNIFSSSEKKTPIKNNDFEDLVDKINSKFSKNIISIAKKKIS